MTNREKWTASMYEEHPTDNVIEDFICRNFVTAFLDEACPGCPLGSMCRWYVDEGRTEEQYMAKVTEWLDEEVKDD